MATSAQREYSRSGDIDKLLEDVLLHSTGGSLEEPVYARVSKVATSATGALSRTNASASVSRRCQSFEVLESVSVFRVHPPLASGDGLAARPAIDSSGWRSDSSSLATGNWAPVAKMSQRRCHQEQALCQGSETAADDRFAFNSQENAAMTAGTAGRAAAESAMDCAEYTEIAALRPIGRGIQTLASHQVSLAKTDRRGNLWCVTGRRSLHQSAPALQQTPTQQRPTGEIAVGQRSFRVGNLRAATLQASSSPSVGRYLQAVQQQQQPRSHLLEQAIAQVSDASKTELESLQEAVRATSSLWYRPTLSRDEASSLLKSQPGGSFVVRQSASHPGCYDLALRVPPEAGRASGALPVRHFLLERCGGGGIRVRGGGGDTTTEFFASLAALVTAATTSACRSFPCRLRLPQPAQTTAQMSIAAPIVATRQRTPLECAALYLAAVDVETVTGAAAVAKATEALMRSQRRGALRPRACRLRAMPDGSVRICGGGDGDGSAAFEKCIPAGCILHCGFDPGMRSFDSEEAKTVGLARPRIFGFIVRNRADTTENTAILACDLCDPQRAESLVQCVRQFLGL